jgi:hypothetical protein
MSHEHVPSVHQALVHYIRFYQAILPFRKGFIVGTFEDVVDDFGRVIRKVNKRFNSSFIEFVNTQENIATCFDKIDYAKPNAIRNTDMELARKKLDAAKLQKRIQRAKTIHRAIFK